MLKSTIGPTLAALLLLAGFNATALTETKAGAKVAVSSAVPALKPSNQAQVKKPTTIKTRLVDINSAGINELSTLPGVTDEVAEKIIAGRPFGSKAQLTTRGIVNREAYEGIKTLVIAKQNAETTTKLLKNSTKQ